VLGGGVLLLALVLRLWHIDHGLPDFTEEAFVFRKGLGTLGPGRGSRGSQSTLVRLPVADHLHFLIQQGWFAASGLAAPADFLLHVLTDPTGPVVASRVAAMLALRGLAPAFIPLARAEALLQMGREREARGLLESVAQGADPGSATLARERLEKMTVAR
jgi:hypothetical protein